MEIASTALCSRCQEIALAPYFESERRVVHDAHGHVGPAEDALNLCSLLELHEKSYSCALCGIIAESLLRRKAQNPWSKVYLKWAETDINLRGTTPQIYLYSYLFAEDSSLKADTPAPDSLEGVTSAVRAFRLGIGLRKGADTIQPCLDHARRSNKTRNGSTNSCSCLGPVRSETW